MLGYKNFGEKYLKSVYPQTISYKFYQSTVYTCMYDTTPTVCRQYSKTILSLWWFVLVWHREAHRTIFIEEQQFKTMVFSLFVLFVFDDSLNITFIFF